MHNSRFRGADLSRSSSQQPIPAPPSKAARKATTVDPHAHDSVASCMMEANEGAHLRVRCTAGNWKGRRHKAPGNFYGVLRGIL